MLIVKSFLFFFFFFQPVPTDELTKIAADVSTVRFVFAAYMNLHFLTSKMTESGLHFHLSEDRILRPRES